jgi:hypothetical protein
MPPFLPLCVRACVRVCARVRACVRARACVCVCLFVCVFCLLCGPLTRPLICLLCIRRPSHPTLPHAECAQPDCSTKRSTALNTTPSPPNPTSPTKVRALFHFSGVGGTKCVAPPPLSRPVVVIARWLAAHSTEAGHVLLGSLAAAHEKHPNARFPPPSPQLAPSLMYRRITAEKQYHSPPISPEKSVLSTPCVCMYLPSYPTHLLPAHSALLWVVVGTRQPVKTAPHACSIWPTRHLHWLACAISLRGLRCKL